MEGTGHAQMSPVRLSMQKQFPKPTLRERLSTGARIDIEGLEKVQRATKLGGSGEQGW